ncbi:hypothetical protein [Kitasatospora sp. NPDC048407]|uniref:hypothetical protein n=1 Tax=Kitasatospora sp. NPDC048407 TaxID=3364051 RepID=UPI00371A27F0
MPDDPALRDAWHRTQHDAEAALRPVLAARTDLSPDSLDVRLLAAAANAAMRVAVEA